MQIVSITLKIYMSKTYDYIKMTGKKVESKLE